LAAPPKRRFLGALIPSNAASTITNITNTSGYPLQQLGSSALGTASSQVSDQIQGIYNGLPPDTQAQIGAAGQLIQDSRPALQLAENIASGSFNIDDPATQFEVVGAVAAVAGSINPIAGGVVLAAGTIAIGLEEAAKGILKACGLIRPPPPQYSYHGFLRIGADATPHAPIPLDAKGTFVTSAWTEVAGMYYDPLWITADTWPDYWNFWHNGDKHHRGLGDQNAINDPRTALLPWLFELALYTALSPRQRLAWLTGGNVGSGVSGLGPPNAPKDDSSRNYDPRNPDFTISVDPSNWKDNIGTIPDAIWRDPSQQISWLSQLQAFLKQIGVPRPNQKAVIQVADLTDSEANQLLAIFGSTDTYTYNAGGRAQFPRTPFEYYFAVMFVKNAELWANGQSSVPVRYLLTECARHWNSLHSSSSTTIYYPKPLYNQPSPSSHWQDAAGTTPDWTDHINGISPFNTPGGDNPSFWAANLVEGVLGPAGVLADQVGSTEATEMIKIGNLSPITVNTGPLAQSAEAAIAAKNAGQGPAWGAVPAAAVAVPVAAGVGVTAYSMATGIPLATLAKSGMKAASRMFR